MARLLRPHRRQALHKGSFGDVMSSAAPRAWPAQAVLAGRAALAAGRGGSMSARSIHSARATTPCGQN